MKPPDLMISENGSPFAAANLDEAARRTLVGSGPGWVASRKALWANGRWRPLAGITAKDPDIETITLLDILDNGAGLARITKTSGPTPKFALLRMTPFVEELAPALRDENNDEIPGSRLPAAIPASNEMVERDPDAEDLSDASRIRIAWREIKVRIGKNFADKTVEWSMEPLFVPPFDPIGPIPDPRFRGKWGTAANVEHRNRFSPSGAYGAHGFEALDPQTESGTDATVHTRARTTVDENGYTAIRVNLPPVGFNKARISIEIEDHPALAILDLEVPAVVVIDPGHGSGRPTGGSGEGGRGLVTHVQEYDTALDIGTRILGNLGGLAKANNLLIREYSTKDKDDSRKNIGLNTRESKAREFGADLLLSLHFDDSTHDPDSKVALYRCPFGMIDQDDTIWNRNPRADWALALRIRKAVQAAIAEVEPPESSAASAQAYEDYNDTHDPDAVPTTSESNEANLQKGLGALNDGNPPINGRSPGQNGNYKSGNVRYVPCRAALIEMERISNKQADELFNGNTAYDAGTGEITLTQTAENMRATVAGKIAEACVRDLRLRDLADWDAVPKRSIGRLDPEPSN
jgi:N-acetylmuramoyl-L-alanine amidase